jgi:5-methylcytosine-specific restriction endonuclease McrA
MRDGTGERNSWGGWKPAPVEEYHHVIPFSEGGSNKLDNIVTLCHECHAKTTKEWRRLKAAQRRQEKDSL